MSAPSRATALPVSLITNLPVKGVVVGLVLVLALLVAYLVWGGAPGVEDLFERVVPPSEHAGVGAPTGESEATETGADRYRILVGWLLGHMRGPKLPLTGGVLVSGVD